MNVYRCQEHGTYNKVNEACPLCEEPFPTWVHLLLQARETKAENPNAEANSDSVSYAQGVIDMAYASGAIEQLPLYVQEPPEAHDDLQNFPVEIPDESPREGTFAECPVTCALPLGHIGDHFTPRFDDSGRCLDCNALQGGNPKHICDDRVLALIPSTEEEVAEWEARNPGPYDPLPESLRVQAMLEKLNDRDPRLGPTPVIAQDGTHVANVVSKNVGEMVIADDIDAPVSEEKKDAVREFWEDIKGAEKK